MKLGKLLEYQKPMKPDPSKMVNLQQWWTYRPEQVMGFVYWTKNLLPPSDPGKRKAAWDSISAQLAKVYPPPTEGGLNEIRKKKIFKCEFDQQYFSTKAKLDAHRMMVHGELKIREGVNAPGKINITSFKIIEKTAVNSDPGDYPSGGGSAALPDQEVHYLRGYADVNISPDIANSHNAKEIIFYEVGEVIKSEYGEEAADSVKFDIKDLGQNRFRVVISDYEEYEKMGQQ